MKYGFIISIGNVHEILEMAAEAEATGWDGVFTWDGIYIQQMPEVYDPWTLMAAIAMRTERVKIGAMLTPLSRRRPWKVARETMTIDQLSHGRLVLPVGLGAIDDGGFARVGEVLDRKVRAQLLDESLEIITGLWSGKPFRFQGEHYHVDEMTFLPTPVQQPRIPIWVVGAWPSMKSMRRVLKYDALLPAKVGSPNLTPDDMRAMKTFIEQERQLTTHFDIVMEGETPADDSQQSTAIVQPWADAGATWWLESRWSTTDIEVLRKRIRQGPPQIS